MMGIYRRSCPRCHTPLTIDDFKMHLAVDEEAVEKRRAERIEAAARRVVERPCPATSPYAAVKKELLDDLRKALEE